MRDGLVDLAYVRLAGETETRGAFLSDVVGLQKVAGYDGDLAFRCDDRTCTMAVAPGGETPSIGVEVDGDAALDHLAEALTAAGFSGKEATIDECKRRFVKRALLVEDASGNRVDFVLRPARSGRRFFGTRDTGMQGLSAIGLRSTNILRDLAFWTAAGAIISDRVGDIAYLRLDAMHHRIALYPSDRNGLLYVTFAVESLDCIMQNFYHLQERQIRILQGPGRERASGQNFVRFADGAGQMFAFGSDMAVIDDTRHRPRQFGLDRSTICAWGSECRDTPELRVAER